MFGQTHSTIQDTTIRTTPADAIALGYVRNWFDKKHNFEVIVGKSILSFGEDEEDRDALAQALWVCANAGYQSKRRLYEVLQSQDLQMNQEITFLSDGDDTLRQLQLEMSPKATHILDWFHLTMKLTVLGQYRQRSGAV